MILIKSRNREAEKQSLAIERESDEARLIQERDVEFRRAQQRAELARERAEREREAEEAQIVSHEAIERARNGGGPTLLEVKVSRYYGHFEGDQQTYRAPGEVQKLRETKDCLLQFRRRVTANGEITAEQLDAIDAEVLTMIDDSVVKAKSDPKPVPADLMTDVYVSY